MLKQVRASCFLQCIGGPTPSKRNGMTGGSSNKKKIILNTKKKHRAKFLTLWLLSIYPSVMHCFSVLCCGNSFEMHSKGLAGIFVSISAERIWMSLLNRDVCFIRNDGLSDPYAFSLLKILFNFFLSFIAFGVFPSQCLFGLILMRLLHGQKRDHRIYI